MKKSTKSLLTTLIVGLMSITNTFSNGGESSFSTNSLILNGKLLNEDTFWKGSKGKLALVKGNPNSKNVTKVPFRIYLKHEGKIVNNGLSSDTQEQYEVEVAPILALALPGDELVIESAQKGDSQAKRIINLTKVDYMYMFLRPFFTKTKSGNGC